MKILHLTLKKKWFDLIAEGKKTVEYREYKPYWISRLLQTEHRVKIFDEIWFRNGYSKNAPFMRVEYDGVMIIDPKQFPPDHGECLKGKQFALLLGKVLQIINS